MSFLEQIAIAFFGAFACGMGSFLILLGIDMLTCAIRGYL
jgi:hypothetical protein